MDNSGTQAIETMEEVDALLKMTETLNPWEQTKFRSSTQDFRFGIIGKTEFNSLVSRLKDNLRDAKIDEKKTIEENARTGPRIRVKPYGHNPKEDVTNHGIDKERKMEVHSEVKEKLSDLLKAIEETLSPRQMRLYTSLCKKFQSHRIGYGTFVTNLLVLIEEKKSLYHRFIRFANGTDKEEEQEDEVGETRHGEDTLGDPKIGTCPDFRVEVEENSQWDKTNLEVKNKKRILSPKDTNLPLKKRKRSDPQRRVTPNYRLIPEELRSPVSDPVLNNTYSVVKRYDFEGGKVLTGVEEEMIKCEDEMYEADMLMSALRSAVESVERVMREEMRVEDLGVKFYRCVERLYRRDMFETVREDHHGALPVIILRLNQKLSELTVARESWKRGWKKTFKRLSPTQKDSDAQKSQVHEVKETTI